MYVNLGDGFAFQPLTMDAPSAPTSIGPVTSSGSFSSTDSGMSFTDWAGSKGGGAIIGAGAGLLTGGMNMLTQMQINKANQAVAGAQQGAAEAMAAANRYAADSAVRQGGIVAQTNLMMADLQAKMKGKTLLVAGILGGVALLTVAVIFMTRKKAGTA